MTCRTLRDCVRSRLRTERWTRPGSSAESIMATRHNLHRLRREYRIRSSVLYPARMRNLLAMKRLVTKAHIHLEGMQKTMQRTHVSVRLHAQARAQLRRSFFCKSSLALANGSLASTATSAFLLSHIPHLFFLTDSRISASSKPSAHPQSTCNRAQLSTYFADMETSSGSTVMDAFQESWLSEPTQQHEDIANLVATLPGSLAAFETVKRAALGSPCFIGRKDLEVAIRQD